MKALLLLPLGLALGGCVGYGGAVITDGGYGYSHPGHYYSQGGYPYYGGSTSVYVTPAPQPYYHGSHYGGRAWRDRDRDGVPNRWDRDRDGDGVRNRDDRYPNNPRRY
jgi:hypothetical protein